MTRRAFPDRVAFQDEEQRLTETGYLAIEDLKDAPSIEDLEPLEGIDASSSVAEIGAAIQAYVTKVKA